MVEVYATITDGQDEPVARLTVADSQIAEDGVVQTISAFVQQDDQTMVVANSVTGYSSLVR
jgi:hypothetical protein